MKQLVRSYVALLMLVILILLRELPSWTQDGSTLTEVEEPWGVHVQATTVSQWHPAFPEQYSGPNSHSASPEFRTSLTSTLSSGARLWPGVEFYVNPELAPGSGFSHTLGVAMGSGRIFGVSFNSYRFPHIPQITR